MTELSRRALLLSAAIAGGVALAGCSGGPTIPTPTAPLTGSVTEQLDQMLSIVSAGSNTFGVAIHGVHSGADYGFSADYASQSASMAKPMIVAMALRKARADGGQLSAELSDAAVKAITHSDNDAAQALWDYAGPDGYTALAGELKMTNTHLDQNKSDQWSWTWTTPADQLIFLSALVEGGTDALTEAERSFIYDLMGKVQADQTWGVGAPKSGSVAVHLKNGWVQFKSSDGLWAVNSMGSVAGDGRDYRMAVMTRVPDFDTGRELTSEVGRQVFSILGSGGF